MMSSPERRSRERLCGQSAMEKPLIECRLQGNKLSGFQARALRKVAKQARLHQCNLSSTGYHQTNTLDMSVGFNDLDPCHPALHRRATPLGFQSWIAPLPLRGLPVHL